RSHQSEQRPGALMRSARSAFLRVYRVITVVTLTPSAVRILSILEPAHRATHRGVTGGDAGLRERSQYGPRAINVVGAPAPEPRPVRLLLAAQVIDRARKRRAVLRTPHPRQRCHDPRRDITGRGVE